MALVVVQWLSSHLVQLPSLYEFGGSVVSEGIIIVAGLVGTCLSVDTSGMGALPVIICLRCINNSEYLNC